MVGISRRSIVEWTYEGGLKCMMMQSRCQREPARYQWGTYDSMFGEWMYYINLGGTAEVEFISFCPLSGAEVFLF